MRAAIRSLPPKRRCLPAGLSLAALALPGTVLAHVLDPSHDPSSVAGGSALAWSLEPWVVALLVLSLGLYLAGFVRLRARSTGQARALRRRQAMAFVGGWITLAVALVSPLDTLASALFSAHMVQHEMLMIVAAPLCVLGRPIGVWLWAFPRHWRLAIGGAARSAAVRAAWGVLTAPAVAWALHAVALWAWHAPRWFELALREPGVHALQHFSFLASALLFWWTVFGPRASGSGSHGGASAMLSLFTTMVHTGALGALLTLAPGLWYPAYIEPTTALGLQPLQDQQMGGLVMWVPGGLAYLAAALAIAARWLAATGAGQQEPQR